MENSPCLNCKFADWARNSAGALHPSGHGKCTWEGTMVIAGSAQNPTGKYGTSYGGTVVVKGGYIDRKQGVVKGCLVREPK